MSATKAVSQGPIGGRWPYNIVESKKDSLFSYIKRSHAVDYFLVYRIDYNGKRRYAAFSSAVDFFVFYSALHGVKEYHEVILGECSQKARFDIDLTLDKLPNMGLNLKEFGDFVRQTLIDAIGKCLIEEYSITMNISKDIRICTSHSSDLSATYDDGAKVRNAKVDDMNPEEKKEWELNNVKYSCHIIMPNHYHYNQAEAREFHNKVIKKGGAFLRSVEQQGIIDGMIHGSLKSFRIIGSSKGGNRVKSYVSTIGHHDESIRFPRCKTDLDQLRLFTSTAITCISGADHNAVRISVVLPEAKIFKATIEIPHGSMEELEKLIDMDTYEVLEVKGTLIPLRRKQPSFCDKCNRMHETEHPYLTVDKSGNVKFFCRRTPGSVNIGCIAVKPISDSPPKESPPLLNDSPYKKSSPGSPVGTPPPIYSNKRVESPEEILTYVEVPKSAITHTFNPRFMDEIASGVNQEKQYGICRTEKPPKKVRDPNHIPTMLSLGGLI